MKILLTILTLIISISAHATHWLTYYVYFETEYNQGTWIRTDILEKSDYKYLAPEPFEDLFGSADEDLINKMLSRLKDKKPDIYNMPYDLVIKNDTVILTYKGSAKQIATIKNEVTATLILNHFKAVTFNFNDTQETLTLADLTLPYFDLVETKKMKAKEVGIEEPITTVRTEMEELKADTPTKKNPTDAHSPLITLFIISGVFNFGLIGLLLYKRNKTH